MVRVDRRRDLALLAVPTTEAPVPLGETEGLQPGAPLLAVGYPRPDALGARSATVTRGVFSGLKRAPEDVWFVQTDAAVNPGNSGGPLVDAQGRVVGIVTAGVSGAEGLNLAVGANEVRVFLASGDNPPPRRPPPPAPTAAPPGPRRRRPPRDPSPPRSGSAPTMRRSTSDASATPTPSSAETRSAASPSGTSRPSLTP